MKALCTFLMLIALCTAKAQYSVRSIPEWLYQNITEDQLSAIQSGLDFYSTHNTLDLKQLYTLNPALNQSQLALLDDQTLVYYILNFSPYQEPVPNKEPGSENPRIVAAVLALTLGPFGVHRMYLGTDLKVPIFYTLTLGGGLGILPLIDFFYILLSKDEGVLEENGHVFMWGEK